MSLAQRVRDCRYNKGWGPDELASRAAISRTALYQIESGKTELPRAGTLRRIAVALDVSMDALLGHPEQVMADVFSTSHPAATPAAELTAASRSRGMSVADWYSNEGVPTASKPHRPAAKDFGPELSRFGVEHGPAGENGLGSREREIAWKLREVLASPFGDAVARIVEESYRLLPQGRVAEGYD